MYEREIEAVARLQSPRGGELRFRIVDAYDSRSAPRKPSGDVCCTTSELDRVFPGQVVGKQAELRFWNMPYAPDRRISGPASFTRSGIALRAIVPNHSVFADVFRQIVHRKLPSGFTADD